MIDFFPIKVEHRAHIHEKIDTTQWITYLFG